MGWSLAFIFFVLLLRGRGRLRATAPAESPTGRDASAAPAAEGLSYSSVLDLVVLQLELDQLRQGDALSDERHRALWEDIKALWSKRLRDLGAEPGNGEWHARRARAWARLARHSLAAGDPPPWTDHEPLNKPAAAARPEISPLAPPLYGVEPAVFEGQLVAGGQVSLPRTYEPARAEPPPAIDGASAAPVAPSDDARSYAWQPVEPGVLERAFKTFSGWHAWLAPFLVQNIGWFIGGFCFLAGSVFLVSYTTGFAKALAIFGALLAYTLLLLYSGYQLRRRRPELHTSSQILIGLGVLLCPLAIAAATRMLMAAALSPGRVAVALCVAGLGVAALYPAVMLASALIDRRLIGHPRLFLALSLLQLSAPVLDTLASWPALALIHLALLVLLGYAALLLTREWVPRIVDERRAISYYAAGTLGYAALTSFLHTIWGTSIVPPAGYYGPFLMGLCGALFYVEAQIKLWAYKRSLWSRFTFLLYGTTVLALVLVLEAPLARIITLAFAIVLYGFLVWHYLSLTPLYLLLGSWLWLYASTVLEPFTAELHLLLGLPGLLGLYAINNSWVARRSARLSEITARVTAAAVAGVAGWSLWHSQNGVVAFGSGALATALLYALLWPRAGALATRRASGPAPTRRERGSSPAAYLVPLLAAVTLAYAPQGLGLDGYSQFAIGLLGLAAWWTRVGLRSHGTREARSVDAKVLLHSAVAALVVAPLAVGWAWMQGLTAAAVLVLVLLAAGAMLLWLSLALYRRSLCYAMLSLVATAGAVLKLEYFPEPSSGAFLMFLALALWFLLGWVERADLG